MDPVVKALVEHYGMSQDLAERTAANLRKPGAATNAYPKAVEAGTQAQSGAATTDVERQRVAYFNQLQARASAGEDIGEENRAWLQQVQQSQAQPKQRPLVQPQEPLRLSHDQAPVPWDAIRHMDQGKFGSFYDAVVRGMDEKYLQQQQQYQQDYTSWLANPRGFIGGKGQ